MALETIINGLCLALAAALLGLGGVTAMTAGNVMRRLIGLMLSLVGAVTALAVLGAPGVFLVAGVAIASAYAIIGVSLIVRTQEDYGSGELAEVDAADAGDEPTEAAR